MFFSNVLINQLIIIIIIIINIISIVLINNHCKYFNGATWQFEFPPRGMNKVFFILFYLKCVSVNI